jgi:hypothetical protein
MPQQLTEESGLICSWLEEYRAEVVKPYAVVFEDAADRLTGSGCCRTAGIGRLRQMRR